MADVVAATEVRARLFDSLEPLTRGVIAVRGPSALERLRFYLRPFPLKGETPGARLFVMLISPDGSPDAGEELTSGLVEHMPNHEAVTAAVDDALAGVLAMLGTEASDDLVAAAVAHRAVVMLVARPADGSVTVLAVPKGKPAMVLGALTNEPATAH